MNHKADKKLKKLAIIDAEDAALTSLTRHFVKDSDLIKGASISAGIGTAVATVGAVAVGAIGAINGTVDVQQTMLTSGLVAAGLAAGTNLYTQDEIVYRVGKGKLVTDTQNTKLLACIAGATVLCGGLGAGVGAGAHKLTTSIIGKLKPEHQIERTVEVEPIPVIDEIQVEK